MSETILECPPLESGPAAGGSTNGAAELRRRVDWVMAASLVLGILLLGAALLGPLLSAYDPDSQRLLDRLKPPLFLGGAADHPLGTDPLGRDILTRCLHGLRLSLALAFAGSILGLAVGGLLGLVSGFAGGLVDDLIMALVDLQIAVPFTLIALLAVAVFGNSLTVLVVVLGVAYWEHYARLVRGQVLALRAMPYIEAARAAGASPGRIAVRHIAPNILSPVVVMFTINVSNLVLLESALSFLGLGAQPPTATLGSMVGQGRDYMASAPWIVLAPALMIVLLALAVMLLGDGLRDRLDVRLQDR
jgi:peptide/nickel transport system permease protein